MTNGVADTAPMRKGGGAPPFLELHGVRKSFAGVEVLHCVNLTLRAGEVVALIGENGAGKSTLMKIIGGVYTATGGDVLINGRSGAPQTPRAAEARGIRIIHQELSSAPELSVTENVLMGRLPRRAGPLGAWAGAVDWPEAHRQAANALSALGSDINPRDLVGRLSIGRQQVVEIAKALGAGEARLLILDEPTAALTAREVRALFAVIAGLRARGVAMAYISHRLEEVAQIADRVVVLRDGNVVADAPVREISQTEIIRLMVGRDVDETRRTGASPPAAPATPSPSNIPPALRVTGLTRRGSFENVSFVVRPGEVVALYGLLGAGQSDVLSAIFGAVPIHGGQIEVAGRGAVSIRSPRDARRAQIGLVPEDRKAAGLALGMTVSENLTLGNWSSVSRGAGVLSPSRERERVAHWMQKLGVRAPGGAGQVVGSLSGGNQQKVVLARWLEAGVRVLLLSEPTRGVDMGARADIYHVLDELRGAGLAVVLASSDLQEALAVCDRILVFVRGRVSAEFDRDAASEASLLAAATAGNAEGNA